MLDTLYNNIKKRIQKILLNMYIVLENFTYICFDIHDATSKVS